jgi:hypothetical protein
LKTISFLFLLTSISLVSCNKETVSESFSLGLENNFKIHGEYNSIDNLLNFEIVEINDSRCPSDVVCVWQGKADVKIEIRNPVHSSIILNTFDNQIDSVGNYLFELKDVSPYPISTKVIKLEEFNVTLKIVELTK